LKKVRVEDAPDMILAHDITEIIPGKKKDVAFTKGTVIKTSDVERLLDLGKRHLYVFDGFVNGVHEDDAGLRIARAIMGKHMEVVPPKEGKVAIRSTVDGLFKVNPEMLYAINLIKDVLVTTLPSRYPVKAGDLIAAARIIPLYIDEKSLSRVEKGWKNRKMISVLPFKSLSAGIVVTGSEVFDGRVPDSSHIVEAKVKKYGSTVIGKRVVTDDVPMIRDAIVDLFAQGADIVITTAGLSVDPDDVTQEGIEATGAKTLFYGTPIAPGAMFLLAKLDGKYILGAPACVYFNGYTALDIVLIRLLAGEKVSRRDVAMLGYGGLCTYCDVCHYPACHFGKGL
jgi:hypothetical protein